MNGAGSGNDNAISFTEIDGADDATAAVPLVAREQIYQMQTSANLSKLEITIPNTGTGKVQAGDQLIITQTGSDKVIDLGFTSEVTTPQNSYGYLWKYNIQCYPLYRHS